MTDDRLLTVADIAARLGAHEETIRSWLREGRLKGIRPGGTKLGWRIAESELRRFLESRTNSRGEDDKV